MKRLFRKRWVRWTFGIIAALVVWFVATELYGEWKWNRYVEDARKRGVKLYIEEFLPKEPIPDAENFAAIPVFRQAYANGKGYEEIPKTSWYIGRRRLPDERGPKRVDFGRTLYYLEKDKSAPPSSAKSLDDIVTNALKGAEALAAMEKKKGATSNSQASDIEKISRELQVMEPFLTQIRDAAQRPKSRYEADWSQGVATKLDHLTPPMAMSRALALKGVILLAKEDSAGALDVFLDLERLAKTFDSEPTFISWLAGDSMRGKSMTLVDDGLHFGAWSDAALAKIQSTFEERNAIAGIKFAMESERAIFNTSLELMLKKRDVSAVTNGFWKPSKPIEYYIRLRAVSSNWWRTNMIWVNQAFDEEISQYDSTAQRWRRLEDRKHDVSKLDGLDLYELQIATAAVPAVASFSKRAVFNHAMDRMAALACALERCKRARGSYPESLSELVPDFTAALPHDPVTGESFKYSRSDTESYLLYSTGEDGKDDGGAMGEEFREVESGSPDWRWFAPRGE